MTGWIKIYRTLAEDPFWLGEPFTRAQAWIDLLLLANFEERSGYYGDQFQQFKKGYVYISQQALAARWKWSRKRVSTYLSNLAKMGMVSVTTLNGKGTAINILKWKEFQENKPKGTGKEQPENSCGNNQGAAEEHTIRNKECKRRKEDNSADAKSDCSDASDIWKDGF